MKLGSSVKEKRTELGLTQQDLAEQLNVSRPTISNWETGRSYPDLDSLLQLSDILGLTVDSLLRGDTQTMNKMNTHMKRGKHLRQLLIFLLVPALIIITLISLRAYKDANRTLIAGTEIEAIHISSGDTLTKQTILTGTVNLPPKYTVDLTAYEVIDETLYLMIYASPGLNRTNNFSLDLQTIPHPEKLTTIAISYYNLEEVDGYSLSEFLLFPTTVVWNKP